MRVNRWSEFPRFKDDGLAFVRGTVLLLGDGDSHYEPNNAKHSKDKMLHMVAEGNYLAWNAMALCVCLRFFGKFT